MQLNDLKKILATSSQDEWIVDDETGSFTYKNDLNLRIERAEYDTYRNFDEPWATKHPDSSSKAVEYTVKYGSSFIERHTLVSVDGHRATLPIPKSINDLRVKPSEVNFARIVDMGNRVEEYLRRSNIVVNDYE
ncbi:hypothetical protein [Psychrobacter sp.]|uniref:hypothetical protein n=1 Tax=Psychrobacter sp. TaxID=56811 RepID=UPI003568552A